MIGEENKKHTGNEIDERNDNDPKNDRLGEKPEKRYNHKNQQRNQCRINGENLAGIFTEDIQKEHISQNKRTIDDVILSVSIGENELSHIADCISDGWINN